MKIAFVGKGGSGKTTLSALFARALAAQGLPVLAIDADINQHMAITLGATPAEAAKVPAMGIEIMRIKEYLRGTNPRFTPESMIKTTPPGSGSRLIKVVGDNPIYDYFARTINGVRFLATGEFTEEDLGLKCYHSKLGATELILSHLIDSPNEYVVVDMTAGADSFAGGMFMKFDITFMVCEPTIKSVSVYSQYKNYARSHNINLQVVGNKVEGSDDGEFLQRHIGSDLLACFERSQYVRGLEKGADLPLSKLEPANAAVLAALKAKVDATPKNWDRFYKDQVILHRRTAKSWAGEDVVSQIDPTFSLAAAAAKLA